jgi:hypothetical protein
MMADLEPKLTMLSIELAASSAEDRQYAFLIYADDNLVAVLSQPQPAARDLRRSWILEAGFGPCGGPGPTTWHDLGAFHQWVLDRCRLAGLGAQPDRPRATRGYQGARAPGDDAGPEVWRAARSRKARTDMH